MASFDLSKLVDAVLAHKRGITLQQGRALRDNPIAIAEGAAGAPSILPNIAANAAADGIGTYVWAKRTTGGGDVAYGSTLAGSSLSPTSAFTALTGTFGTTPGTLDNGSALSGTWRCMGTFDQSQGTNVTGVGATLWLRIS